MGLLIPSPTGAPPDGWYYQRVWQITSPRANLKQITVTATVQRSSGAWVLRPRRRSPRSRRHRSERSMADMMITRRQATMGWAGFTLIELLVSMCVLMVVSGMVVSGTVDLTRLTGTVVNRSDMHAGVRNATALLQQEVGQAGRVSLPGSGDVTGERRCGCSDRPGQLHRRHVRGRAAARRHGRDRGDGDRDGARPRRE